MLCIAQVGQVRYTCDVDSLYNTDIHIVLVMIRHVTNDASTCSCHVLSGISFASNDFLITCSYILIALYNT